MFAPQTSTFEYSGKKCDDDSDIQHYVTRMGHICGYSDLDL